MSRWPLIRARVMTSTRPRRQRRARRVHVRARIDLLLPVVRHVVDEAADQHACDQASRGQAFVDDLWLDRLLHQRLAALAGLFAAGVAMHALMPWAIATRATEAPLLANSTLLSIRLCRMSPERGTRSSSFKDE
jgi:hypothetical protein